jgi:hypothetical protein
MAGVKKLLGPNIQRRKQCRGKGRTLEKSLHPLFPTRRRPAFKNLLDEARFGRINKVSRSWVPQGGRATVKKQVVREHTYAFSAVKSGKWETYSFISPVCNTAAMNELLGGLSKAYAAEQILVLTDSAGWHKSKELTLPTNIQLQLLPPYSPELWSHRAPLGLGSKRDLTTMAFTPLTNWKTIYKKYSKTSTRKKTISNPYAHLNG